MPDGIPAVASQVRAPDPNAGLTSYSNILGIQQQRQALQTGQYTQQSAAATADQDQQKNRELQAAQKLALNGAQSGRYANPDGSFNRQKMADDISQVAPTYGQGISTTLLSQANEIVSNHTALQGLNEKQQAQVASAVAPLASKPDLTHEDVINALDQVAEINPATRRMAISMGASIPANATTAQLQQYMRQLGLKATSPEYNSGTTAPNVQGVQGVGQPGQPGAGQPGLVPTNMNPQAPGGVGQAGPVQQQSVAPGAAPVTDAYGRTSVFNPQRNTVAPIGAGGPGSSGAAPGASAFVQPVAGQHQVEQDIDVARKAGDSGGQVRAINDKLLNLSEQTRTGPGAQSVQKLAAALNLPSGSNYQEINAYLERQAAAAGQAMGLPNTNAGLHAAQQASGTAEYTPQALQEKVKFADALNSGVMAYRQGLDKLVGTGATPDYGRYQEFRSAWAQNFSPDVFRAEDAIRRGDKKELSQLKSELGSRGMAEMKKRADNLRVLENGQIPR